MLLDRLIGLFAPFCCIGCGVETNKLLCTVCAEEIESVSPRCYLCRTTTRQFAVCTACRSQTPLQRVLVRAHHEGLAKELVHTAKYERAAAGLYEMADHMAPLLRYVQAKNAVIVPLPTATKRVRMRGYDQSVVLARRLAESTQTRWLPCLARLGQAHQVGANRTVRQAHMRGVFRIRRPHLVKGMHVVLVDDVCTTGATLEAAARTLKKAGAASVEALVFSQPH